MKGKIFRGFLLLCAVLLLPCLGLIAAASGGHIEPWLINALAMLTVLALVLSSVLAARLSRKLTQSVDALNLEDLRTDGVCPELLPLLHRLQEQNRTIGRQMEELGRSQREFAALTANMSQGVLLLDRRHLVLSANGSALAFLKESAPPATLRQDRCRRELWEAVNAALAGIQGEALVRQDGRMVELLASPVIASGQVTGAVVLLVDVTEREERESLRREFSANVSHELKTPLTTISGFAELMKEGLVEPDKMKEFAGDIYTACGQLIALVDDILKLSRLDEGVPEDTWEPVELYGLAAGILESLRTPAQNRGVTLSLEGEPQSVPGVWRVLHEMLYNLCDNAIQYNRDGGRVTVRVAEEAGDAVVTVADTGIGIPKDQQSRVFERFYRVDKSHSRQLGGTGLGLSIVKHGAQFHHAQLTLDSEAGAGTTVTLRFRTKGEND